MCTAGADVTSAALCCQHPAEAAAVLLARLYRRLVRMIIIHVWVSQTYLQFSCGCAARQIPPASTAGGVSQALHVRAGLMLTRLQLLSTVAAMVAVQPDLTCNAVVFCVMLLDDAGPVPLLLLMQLVSLLLLYAQVTNTSSSSSVNRSTTAAVQQQTIELQHEMFKSFQPVQQQQISKSSPPACAADITSCCSSAHAVQAVVNAAVWLAFTLIAYIQNHKKGLRPSAMSISSLLLFAVGGEYTLTVTFPQARRALLTTSQGRLTNAPEATW